jgi:polyisoprenyl-teichoic acid--peptidoglycan teichoic acid transferase
MLTMKRSCYNFRGEVMKKKVILIVIPVLLLIIAGGALSMYFYVDNTIHKSTKPEEIFANKQEEEKAKYIEESGVFNILLCGLDGRKTDSDSRTDSMIVANIDTNKKTFKLISFMRDLYVPIPGHGQTRINAAYAIGGPSLLMKTLNEDFNMNIQYYATIDFKAFQAMVDAVGGVDVDVKDYELKQLNYYIKEANWKHPDYLEKGGYQRLNGQQALSYCRIRKVGNNDYERTERQRKVLSLLVSKAKKTSVFKLPQLFTTILPFIKTNIPTTKVANLGYTVYKFGTISVNTARIPADKMFQGMKIHGADVLVPDMDKTVAYIDNFLNSNGSIGNYNMPAYMANNYHIDDVAIDKRKQKINAVKIVIPKDSKKSNTLEPSTKDNSKIDFEVPEASSKVDKAETKKEESVDVIVPEEKDNSNTLPADNTNTTDPSTTTDSAIDN